MKQSRLMTLFETVAGTALGFLVSFVIQYGICRHYGLPLSTSDNLGIIGVFTIASLVRGYVWRRICEALHIRRPLSPFMHAALSERFRQEDEEGFSPDHDDHYDRGELGSAGAAYVLHAGTASTTIPHEWPWPADWWKPDGYRRDMVRGVALAIAEGERFDRERLKRKRRGWDRALS
jgi:hypothetical protein